MAILFNNITPKLECETLSSLAAGSIVRREQWVRMVASAGMPMGATKLSGYCLVVSPVCRWYRYRDASLPFLFDYEPVGSRVDRNRDQIPRGPWIKDAKMEIWSKLSSDVCSSIDVSVTKF